MNPLNQQDINSIKGERLWGEDSMPMDGGDNILSDLPWDKNGYAIFPFLNEDIYKEFETEVYKLLMETLHSVGIIVSDDFNFENYHKVIGNRHLDFVDRIKHIPSSQFPINRNIMDERLSEICEIPMWNFNPLTKDRVYHFRIIRPRTFNGKTNYDNNPVHRDTWHWEYRNNVNIYVPICGSNEQSSLPIAEGSHYWNEKELERTKGGAYMNRIQYVVPALTDIKRDFDMIRPNPGRNEVLVFSPYLLHGGAINETEDKTRISLEMRFWRKPNS